MTSSDALSPPPTQSCSEHSKPSGPLSCERCGVFLCENCLFQTAFTPFCTKCISLLPNKLPLNYRSPVSARQIILRYINMGLVTAFILSAFISFVTSFESGFLDGIYILGLSFLLIFLLVLIFGVAVLVFTILVSPRRARMLAERHHSALSLLQSHCRATAEPSSDPSACFRCQSPNPKPPGSLCSACSRAFHDSLCQFDPPPAAIESPPPWSLQTRILIGLLVLWILFVNLFLGFLPAPARATFADWPLLPEAFVAVSLFGLFRLYSKILHALALAPLTNLLQELRKKDMQDSDS